MSTDYADIKQTLDDLGAEKVDIDARRRPANPATINAIRQVRQVLMRAKYEKIARLFPDEGPLSRDKYPKHLEIFRLGKDHTERLFMAANRVGKSILGAYETTCHLTGWYPHWWEGHRFGRPVRAWCCGDTSQTTRDIVQTALLGPPGQAGAGMIPKKLIHGIPRKKPGMPDAIETVWVKHSSGMDSQGSFKSYEQGRKSFQGTELDWIWPDEEPPADIYDEMLTRTMTTNGRILVTATPLSGLTPFILSFLPDGRLPQ